MCGVKTNVVTAVEIHDMNAADAPQLPALVDVTAKNFTIREVSADKGYTGAVGACSHRRMASGWARSRTGRERWKPPVNEQRRWGYPTPAPAATRQITAVGAHLRLNSTTLPSWSLVAISLSEILVIVIVWVRSLSPTCMVRVTVSFSTL
jgi:hypothetical protein